MRIKSNIITIEYAGEVLLQTGGHLNGQNYGGSREFSTTAEKVIDADNPVIRSYGNAQGGMSFETCEDFDSEENAVEQAMLRMSFLERNQSGVFVFTVGESVNAWEAGVQSVDWSVSYMVDSVRLFFSYNFILGARVEKN